MKKFLLFASAATLGLAAAAQTVIVPPTVEEAQAKGWDALWGDYAYGYIMPNDYVVVDDDAIKVVMNNGSASKPGANIATSGINTTEFDRSFQMGSAASDVSFEPVYSLELISDGIKQPYAVFNVTAKQGGTLEMFANRGNNKFTIYVWDRTLNDQAGAYALANYTHAQDLSKNLVTPMAVNLVQDHEYWIFCSGNGANANMYQMIYKPYTAPDYSITEFDASKFSTAVVPPTVEQAQANGWDALWGDYAYGYVMPNETTVADTEDLKVVVNNGSASKPGANIATSGLNTTVFGSSFNMGSAAGDGSFESVYSLELISDGIKQPYAVFNVEAKKGGALYMYSNRGKNKYTMYVWDRTANEEAGTYVLASTSHPNSSDLAGCITESIVGLTAGHNYWIFCSGNGANANMYALGFNNYEAPNYSYTTGIADVTVDAVAPQSNVIYNFQGQVVDENYKGFVIKNGKKYLRK